MHTAATRIVQVAAVLFSAYFFISEKSISFAEMYLQSGYIHYKDNSIHCVRAGKGSRLLLAFHGFGSDMSMFVPLVEKLKDIYTVIAIDLPFHGKTQWNDRHFDIAALMSIVQGFKNDMGVERFSLIGYSIGGRICLNILERQPGWTAEVFLLASDGLKKDIVFQFATRNIIGNKIFNAVSERPQRFLAIADRLNQWKLLSNTRHRFVHNILDDEEQRKKGQQVWNVTSRLIPHKPIIHYNAKKYGVPLHLVMGRHDRLFPPELGEQFIRGLKNADLQVLPAGHNFTDAATMLQVADIILSYQ